MKNQKNREISDKKVKALSLFHLIFLILSITFVTSCSKNNPDVNNDNDENIDPIIENSLYVANTGDDANIGTAESPLLTIDKALEMVEEGQNIYLRGGTYDGYVDFNSSFNKAISLSGYPGEDVTITRTDNTSGYVINIKAPKITIRGLKVDGGWRSGDIIKLHSEANDAVLKKLEVFNTLKDCIDMDSPQNVIVDSCTIHHALRFDNGDRIDAHGIVTAGVQNLTISNTEIYYVSGDALQFQYNGWNNILVENCKLWNGKLPTAIAGFPSNVNPGENAVDTKYNLADGRGKLTMRNIEAYGWDSDYLNNPAAFNIKHNVEAILDGITVYDSDIAFRLRGVTGSNGGAKVTLMNAVSYNVKRVVRYEDDIEDLHVFNCTFGKDNSTLFQSAGGHGTGFLVQNCLFYNNKPSEAAHESNLENSDCFVDINSNNYQLKAGCEAIDFGITIDVVTTDRIKTARPSGSGYDCGAFEYN
ncbi:MAG: hypothetical protein GY756_14340 [bacterium]|nr:hypothetical protein [bacterium]